MSIDFESLSFGAGGAAVLSPPKPLASSYVLIQNDPIWFASSTLPLRDFVRATLAGPVTVDAQNMLSGTPAMVITRSKDVQEAFLSGKVYFKGRDLLENLYQTVISKQTKEKIFSEGVRHGVFVPQFKLHKGLGITQTAWRVRVIDNHNIQFYLGLDPSNRMFVYCTAYMTGASNVPRAFRLDVVTSSGVFNNAFTQYSWKIAFDPNFINVRQLVYLGDASKIYKQQRSNNKSERAAAGAAAAAAAAAGPAPQGGAAAAAGDSDIQLVEERSLNQVLEDRRKRAVAKGDFFDFAKSDSDESVGGAAGAPGPSAAKLPEHYIVIDD